MPVVKINAIEVPPDAGPELEKRFAHRAHAVDNQPGFLGFQLLRPVKGEDRYFVVTQWESEEAFQAWATGPAVEAHAGQRANPGRHRRVAAGVRGCVGRCRDRRKGLARAGRVAARPRLTVAVTLVVALACGCADAGPARPADAAHGRPHRHQHAAGSAGQADHGHAELGLADRSQRRPHAGRARQMVDDVGTTMDKIWWDRPFTLTGRRRSAPATRRCTC